MRSVGLPAYFTMQPRDISLLGWINAPNVCMRHVVVSFSRNGGGFGRVGVKLGKVSILEELPMLVVFDSGPLGREGVVLGGV